LGEEHMENVVEIQLRNLQRLLESRRITLEIAPEARSWLAREGFDPEYGARPLRRLIQRSIQDPLAEAVLSGNCQEKDRLRVSLVDQRLVLEMIRSANS
ncbi:MAG: type VI secretion system ATPase TssH, partial [Magnetococcus sp. YQC-5]